MFLRSLKYENLTKRHRYKKKRPYKTFRGDKSNSSKNGINYVLIFSLLLTATVVSMGILLPEKFNYISTKLFNVLIDKFSPMYLMLMLGIFAFSLYLAFSKYGDIKLERRMINRSLAILYGFPCCLGQEWV